MPHCCRSAPWARSTSHHDRCVHGAEKHRAHGALLPNTPGPHMTPQLDANGRLRNLLTLEGLPRDTLVALLDRAQAFVDGESGRSLAGTAVCTLFFEPSTRTRLSFQRAAQRLGADVLNFDASTSSTTKGETALDTLKNIEAMGVRGFVVRHCADGAVAELAAAAGQDTALLNAGDGRHAHPTQGLLRSEEHTSELQSLMRISYAVFCLKKKNTHQIEHQHL